MVDAADSMAAVFAHHREALCLGQVLDCVADVAQMCARTHQFDRAPHGVLADLGQALAEHRRFTGEVHAAGIAVIAVLDDGDVNVEDVAALEATLIRNAVTDHMVHGSADRLRKTAVTDVRRHGPLHVDDVVVADAIELIGADAGDHVLADHVEHIGCQSAGNPQLLLLLGRFQGDLCSAQHTASRQGLKHCSGWNFMV